MLSMCAHERQVSFMSVFMGFVFELIDYREIHLFDKKEKGSFCCLSWCSFLVLWTETTSDRNSTKNALLKKKNSSSLNAAGLGQSNESISV